MLNAMLHLNLCFYLMPAAYYDQGMLVTDHSLMRSCYMTSGQFLLDIFSQLPIDLVSAVFFRSDLVILRLNRIGRSERLREFFRRTECRTNYPNTFRILHLLFYILMIIHWNACFYFAMSSWIGFGSDRWVYADVNEELYPENASLARMYTFR